MIAAVFIFLASMVHGVGMPSHNSRDSTLKANLVILRSSIENFQSDCNGYPVDLNGLTTKPTQMYVGDVLKAVPADVWKGPYLNAQGGIGGGSIPRNPYLPANDADITHHWSYEGVRGWVAFPTPVGKDGNGEPYINY